MMTTLARAGCVGHQVRDQAHSLSPVAVAVTALMVPFFAVGWVAGAVARVLWAAVAWAWAAALVGWRTAYDRRRDATG